MVGTRIIPNFFIVGAPKCGTTALNAYLRRHPDIFTPIAKELHFFGADLQFINHDITLERYLSNFSSWKGETRIGEASVWYLYSKEAAAEIKRFAPSASIIIMLRNPIEMMHSLYYELLCVGDEELPSFEAALDAEQDRKGGLRIPVHTNVVHSLFYTEIAKYADQVRRYFHAFARDRVHVIIFDDFVKNTARVYRETLEFLCVDASFQTEFKVVNPNQRVRSEFIRLLMRNRPQWLRGIVNTYISQSLKYRVLYKISSLNKVEFPRPEMLDCTRRGLQEQFAPEIRQLSDVLRRDLTHWIEE